MCPHSLNVCLLETIVLQIPQRFYIDPLFCAEMYSEQCHSASQRHQKRGCILQVRYKRLQQVFLSIVRHWAKLLSFSFRRTTVHSISFLSSSLSSSLAHHYCMRRGDELLDRTSPRAKWARWENENHPFALELASTITCWFLVDRTHCE